MTLIKIIHLGQSFACKKKSISEKNQFNVICVWVNSWRLNTTTCVKKARFSDPMNKSKIHQFIKVSLGNFVLCITSYCFRFFFSFAIQIHRRITCNKFLHVPDCSCPVGWPDFSPGAGVPGYSVLIFGVGHLDVIHTYTGVMTYCETI